MDGGEEERERRRSGFSFFLPPRLWGRTAAARRVSSSSGGSGRRVARGMMWDGGDFFLLLLLWVRSLRRSSAQNLPAGRRSAIFFIEGNSATFPASFPRISSFCSISSLRFIPGERRGDDVTPSAPLPFFPFFLFAETWQSCASTHAHKSHAENKHTHACTPVSLFAFGGFLLPLSFAFFSWADAGAREKKKERNGARRRQGEDGRGRGETSRVTCLSVFTKSRRLGRQATTTRHWRCPAIARWRPWRSGRSLRRSYSCCTWSLAARPAAVGLS